MAKQTRITARMVADSKNTAGSRLTTMELTYPRFIHAEVMTHRMFSRNSSSSRAIPVMKSIRAVKDTPARPIHWGANQKGMQAQKELAGWRLAAAKYLWNSHRNFSIFTAYLLSRVGAHKQISNRVIECHSHIKLLVTTSNWANFLDLRDHEAAMPEIRELASKIRLELQVSSPAIRVEGEWHLPYIIQADVATLSLSFDAPKEAELITEGNEGIPKGLLASLIAVSAARCARTSYTTIDRPDDRTYNAFADVQLAEELVRSRPLHASPFEHQACADSARRFPEQHGNFNGWRQYRKLLAGEHTPEIPHTYRK